MSRRRASVWIAPLALCALGALAVPGPAPARAATFEGRAIDDVWYEGRAVSTTWGGYRCSMKFHDDRVFLRLVDAGIEVVGVLDDEAILDSHEIVVHDPKRGGDWTLDCYNLGR